MSRRIEQAEVEVEHTRQQIRALSPLATLQRGYAVLLGPDGTALRSVDSVTAGDAVRATVADGQLELTVDTVSRRAATVG